VPGNVFNTILQTNPLILTASGLTNQSGNAVSLVANTHTFLHDISITNHGQFQNIVQYPSNAGFVINSSTQEITIPRTGVYEVMVSFSLKNTTARYVAVYIYVNGVNITGNAQNSDAVNDSGDDFDQHKTIDIISINQGDLVKFGYQTATNSTIEPSAYKLIIKQIDVIPKNAGILTFTGLSSDHSATTTASAITNMSNETQIPPNYFNVDGSQNIIFNNSGIYEIMISYTTLDDTTREIYAILELDGTSIYPSPYTGQTASTVNNSNSDYDQNKTIDIIEANAGQTLTIKYYSATTVHIDNRFFKLILKKIANTDEDVAEHNKVNIQDLYNVSTNIPNDGQALVYDSDIKEWKPGDISGTSTGGVLELNDLEDVDLTATTLRDGHTIAYNSTTSQWEPGVVAESKKADAIKLIDQARYWVVAGDTIERNNGYELKQFGSVTVHQDNNNYNYFETNTNYYYIDNANALIDKQSSELTYAFVVDFNNNNAGTIAVVGQFNSDFDYQNHKISFYDEGGSGIKTNGNLWYDNFPPSSSSNSMLTSLGSQTIGNRKLYVITLQPNPSNTAEEKVNFYEVQSNGNVELLTSDIGEESYTGSASYTIDRIAFGYSGATSSITRWYGVAAWSKLLTLNEISLLSESLLLDSRTKLVSTFPLSSIAPEQGQALVYNQTADEWQPGTTVVANPDLTGTEDNLTSLTVGGTKYKIGNLVDTAFLGGKTTSSVNLISESVSHPIIGSNYSVAGLRDGYIQDAAGIRYATNNTTTPGWTSSSTWYYAVTIDTAKVIKYVRIWPFSANYNYVITAWNLYGSNNDGTTWTQIGSQQTASLTDWNITSGSQVSTTLAEDHQDQAIRFDFGSNETSYTSFKVEVTSYARVVNGGDAFGLSEIEFGEKTFVLGSGGGASSLNDLTDVSVSGASNGQALVFSGTQWEPSDLVLENSGGINLSEISTPSQPNDGNGVLYTKAGGLPYWRSYDINETALIENGRQFTFYATPVSTAHFLSGSQSYDYYRYASQTKFTIGLVENSSQFFDLNSVIYTVPMDGNYTFGWTTVRLGHSSGSRLIIRVYRNGSYSNLVDSGYSTTSSIRHTVYTGNLLRNDQISWWALGSGANTGGSESGLYMRTTTGISTDEYTIFYGYKN
jgi:hypothetical protein